MAFGDSHDVFLLSFFALVRNWDAFLTFITLYINSAIVANLAKAGTALFTILQATRYFRGLKTISSPSDRFLAQPLIFPCQTAHVRLFPKVHSFSYSYLWVGIPVGWRGSVGGLLSSDASQQSLAWYMRLLSLSPVGAWHTVDGDDYLSRGHAEGGLQEKLYNYLKTQDVDPQQYPYAYLLTAPRFLNYASNPVSIWNLYSAQKELKAFILEVNNTFDERHIYFVRPDVVPSASPDPMVPPKLTNSWPKDFYVSTFNSRAGNYSISATDPLFPSMTGLGIVNSKLPSIQYISLLMQWITGDQLSLSRRHNRVSIWDWKVIEPAQTDLRKLFEQPLILSLIIATITLKSAHVSLVARIFSTGPAIDPAIMSVSAKTLFLLTWWWVGLATFPRTVVQAVKLLFTHKMPWVFRPEPRQHTMPRRADATEIFIEGIFRSFLRSLIEDCEDSLVVNYAPAGLVYGENETMASPAAQLTVGKAEIVEFKVLTPSFYSRFLHYSGFNPIEAFVSEYQSATIALSRPELLLNLKPSLPHQPLNPISHPRFWAIQNLRNKPSPIADDASSAPPSPVTNESKIPNSIPSKPNPPFQPSPFEVFVLTHGSPQERSEYASRVLKMFISEYIAFGFMELLDLEIFIIRSCVAWVLAGVLSR